MSSFDISHALEYAKADPVNMLIILLFLSLVIGTIANLPNSSYVSLHKNKKEYSPAGKSYGIYSESNAGNFGQTKNSDISRHNAKSLERRLPSSENDEGIRRRSYSVHMGKTAGKKDSSKDETVLSKKDSIHFFQWIRFVFISLLPFLVFSIIPSFYPIYKSYIASYLPNFIQHFFTDIKSLFQTLFGLYLSGAIFDDSIASAGVTSDDIDFQSHFSLQDYVFSYLKNCTTSDYIQKLPQCLTCKCDSDLSVLKSGGSGECSLCDICILWNEINGSDFVLNQDNNCSHIFNDFAHIVNAGNTDYFGLSISDVLKECASTFILYMRFSLRLLFNIFYQFSWRIIHILNFILLHYRWIFRQIIDNSQTSKSKSVALIFLLIGLSLTLLVCFRIVFKGLMSIIQSIESYVFPSPRQSSSQESDIQQFPSQSSDVSSLTKPKSKRSGEFDNISSRLGLARRRPVSLSASDRLRPRDITVSSETVDDCQSDWMLLMNENESIARLASICLSNGEEYDDLCKIVEQLNIESVLSDQFVDSFKRVVEVKSSPTPSPLPSILHQRLSFQQSSQSIATPLSVVTADLSTPLPLSQHDSYQNSEIHQTRLNMMHSQIPLPISPLRLSGATTQQPIRRYASRGLIRRSSAGSDASVWSGNYYTAKNEMDNVDYRYRDML